MSPAKGRICPERLRKRADYLAAAAGARVAASAFLMQARARGDDSPPRFGFTVAKRVGNAPERNRVRRRLKAVVRLAQGGEARVGHDYVLIGRRAALTVAFQQLVADFAHALRRANAAAAPRSAAGDPGTGKGGVPPVRPCDD